MAARQRRRRSSLRRAGLISALACAAVLSLGVWMTVRAEGWVDEAVSAALGVGTALVQIIGGALVGQWVSEWRSRKKAPAPSPEELEAWRSGLWQAVLERRVQGPRSQLGQMVPQANRLDVPAVRVGLGAGRSGELRIRIGGRLEGLREITGAWDRSPARLVILGEPGYGKTVTALALLAHINGEEDRPGEPIAELFSLAEWYRWEADHPDSPLSEWLADELVTSYPTLDRSTAEALIARRLVVPLLDGLDEVPASHRRRCTESIDAYAGRTAPFRPFVVTCRAAEYQELAPDWVVADEQVGLVGLHQVDQVVEVLRERTGGQEWQAVRERLEQGDEKLARLFRSPLRLSVALEVYRDGGADELLRLAPTEAEERLWDRLLGRGSVSFAGAPAERVRSWLGFLATGMKRQGRQRFWLHELHLYAPDRQPEIRRFTALLGSIGALAAAAVAGSVVHLLDGPRAAMWAALVTAVLTIVMWLGIAARFGDPDREPPFVRPAVHERAIPFRKRVLAPRYEVAAALVASVLIGWLAHPAHGAMVGLWLGSLVVLSALVEEYLAGWRPVAPDPGGRLRQADARAILRTSFRSGLAWGAGLGQVIGVIVAPIATAASFAYIAAWGIRLGDAASRALAFGFRAFVVAGLVAGVTLAVWHGVGPWLFHHWLRVRLARQGLLPRRLPQFLDWCAEPQRAWLRGSGGYEFRHRGLLDHLAPETDVILPGEAGAATSSPDPTRGTSAPDGESVESVDDQGDDATSSPVVVRLLLLAVPLVCAGIVAFMVFTSLGNEFTVDHVSGDEPRREDRGFVGPDGSAVAVPVDVWRLAPGDRVRSTFRATPRDPLMPADASVDHFAGELAVAGCDTAEVAWRITADGSVIADGALGPPAGDGRPTSDSLSDVAVPGDGDPSTRFVLTAHRTDRGSCTAQLEWHTPGFHAAGIGSGG